MKINKSQLKSIIKECLVELFQENFSNGYPMQQQQKKVLPQQILQQPIQNNISKPTQQQKKTNVSEQQLNTKTKNLNNIQQNIMKEILEDTAKTTYKNMSKADYEFNKVNLMQEMQTLQVEEQPKQKRNKNVNIVQGNTAEEIVQNNDPINLFGVESSNKWLKLAFAEKNSNNNSEE